MFLYIKAYRQRAKIPVPKMSELTGIPKRTIEDLEKRGDCLVSNAVKITDVLGIRAKLENHRKSAFVRRCSRHKRREHISAAQRLGATTK